MDRSQGGNWPHSDRPRNAYHRTAKPTHGEAMTGVRLRNSTGAFRPAFAVGGILLICGLLFSARARAADDVGFDQKMGDSIPLHAQLLDENGDPVALGDFFH